MEGILKMLRSMDFMSRDKRERAKADPVLGTKRGFALGAVLVYDQPEFRMSAHTYRHQELAKAVCKLARDARPDFPFTSCQINKGACGLHVDKNNSGPSLICSLGDHTGGELWQWPGDVLDIHNKIVECNGLVPHATLPFDGERYSIVWYCVRDLRPAPNPYEANMLSELGFYSTDERPECGKPVSLTVLKNAAVRLNAFIMTRSDATSNSTESYGRCHEDQCGSDATDPEATTRHRSPTAR